MNERLQALGMDLVVMLCACIYVCMYVCMVVRKASSTGMVHHSVVCMSAWLQALEIVRYRVVCVYAGMYVCMYVCMLWKKRLQPPGIHIGRFTSAIILTCTHVCAYA